MSSFRRVNSSRANAARSRGPVTLEGKERASTNALRHGLLAECVVLKNESHECFDDLVTQHIQRFAPADGVEFAMIEEMAAANWRMRRAWAIENRLMEKAIRNQPPGDEMSRLADAFSQLAASPELNLLHRYEARLHRIYQRALDNLLLLREPELPNEPNPISEHQPPEEESPPPQPPPPPLAPRPQPPAPGSNGDAHHGARSGDRRGTEGCGHTAYPAVLAVLGTPRAAPMCFPSRERKRAVCPALLRNQHHGGAPESELLRGGVEHAHLARVPAGL